MRVRIVRYPYRYDGHCWRVETRRWLFKWNVEVEFICKPGPDTAKERALAYAAMLAHPEIQELKR